jgi:hypothetical protein
MDDDKALVFDHAQGNETDFTVVRPIIYPGQNVVFKNLGGIKQVDATFPDDLRALVFVPFEIHAKQAPKSERYT